MYDDEFIIDRFKKGLDSKFQDELCLKQTEAYWNMLETMSKQALKIRKDCIAQNKYDGADYLEGLELLTMDDLGIPNESLAQELFEPSLQGLCWTNWWNTLQEVDTFRKKIWTFWIKEGRDFLAVLMNF